MIPYILSAVGGYLIGDSIKTDQYADGGMMAKGGLTESQEELNRIGDSLNSYESELAIEEYMKRTPVKMSDGGELESDRKKALKWWSSLSINEQKEYSRKHLSPYYYGLIWDYSLTKHISPKKYYDLRVEIWKKETQRD
jgi:hypothetical protein